MEPFQIKLEPKSPEKFDDVVNYNNNYLKVDDVNEKLLDNLKSDTSGINNFNIIKEEYDIPDDNHMIAEDSNNSDHENQENYCTNIEHRNIHWPSKKNEQISEHQSHTSTFGIINFTSNNNNLISKETTKLSDNDKLLEAVTVNDKTNESSTKRLTPKFRHYCLQCNEAKVGLGVNAKNVCINCEKLMVLQCLQCNRQYNSPNGMKYHLQICIGKKVAECSKCNRKFKRLSNCKIHERYCGNGSDLTCRRCPYWNKKKRNMKRHIQLHEKYYQQTIKDVKNKTLVAPDNLNDNQKGKPHSYPSTITFSQRYCSKCNKTFQSLLVNPNVCKICKTKLSIKCIACNSLHKDVRAISYHLRYKCIFKTELQCSTCDYSTIRSGDLKRHIQQKHVKIDSEQFYKCSKCTSSFKFKSRLQRHVEYNCAFYKSYLLCDHCPFKTKSKRTIRVHLKSHMASENSAQVFRKKKLANREIESKLLLKAFCSKCGTSRKVADRGTVCYKCKLPLVFPECVSVETSTQPAVNLREKREHDYFKCENCGKAFVRLSNLDCHKKVCKSRSSAGN